MNIIDRFHIRRLGGAVAVTLCLGLAHPAGASDQPQWVRQLGTADYDYAGGVATDGKGNVYVTGYTNWSLCNSKCEFFGKAWIVKFSTSGVLIWKREPGTSSGTITNSSIAVDGNGSIYTSETTYEYMGPVSAWATRYSAAGLLLWQQQLGTYGDSAEGVATDDRGGVCIVGYGFPSGSNQTDAWLAKYSVDGVLRWKQQLGTSGDDAATGVATDNRGNVYIAGATSGSLGGQSQGLTDAWLAKYSAGGVPLWKRQLGTSGDDGATGVAADDNGIYIAGVTSNNQVRSDAWITKYSASGVLLWKRQLGTPDSDEAASVTTDHHGSVYVAGDTWGSLGGPNEGFADAWIAKYSQRP